jgi:hypothetical protein
MSKTKLQKWKYFSIFTSDKRRTDQFSKTIVGLNFEKKIAFRPNCQTSHCRQTSAFACLVPKCHPRQVGYLNVVLLYSDKDFWRHFRVTRATFGLLLDHLRAGNFRTNVAYHGGYHPMSNPEMLLIALQYLGNQGAIRLLADKFDRTESTIWTSVHLICK